MAVEQPVWILRPFKDQKAADVLRKQLSNLRLHSLCILQGGGQRILGGDLKFLEQKKGGYENCLNISGGMLIFCKILSSFCNGFKR